MTESTTDHGAHTSAHVGCADCGLGFTPVSVDKERTLLLAAASLSTPERPIAPRTATLTIEIACGQLFVDGEPVLASTGFSYVHIKGATILTSQGEEFGHVTGPDGYGFTVRNIASYEVMHGMVICTLAS
jgi:hypothetical protein